MAVTPFESMKRNALRLAAGLLLLFVFAPDAPVRAVHRYHTSLTRIDHDPRRKTLEISIQVFTHDLIKVLEDRQAKKLDLAKTPGVDAMILEYIDQNLILRDSAGTAARARWVGKELAVDVVWLYVEIPFAESLEGKRLQNSMFIESFADQTNLVICKYEQKKADLVFKAGDTIKEIQSSGGEH